MDFTLVGVIIGSIIILVLIRGVGFYFARTAARDAYRAGMNAEVRRQRHRIRHSEPRRPDQVYLSGENRYERGPGMEAPPVYSKDDAPPDYVDVTVSSSAPRESIHDHP